MNLKSFNTTKDLFSKIVELHQEHGISSNIAGNLFEEFNMVALPNFVRSDIIAIWNTNNHKDIPPGVIKEIFGEDWNLIREVFKGSSYGLDKIVQFNDSTYGFVSDKSTLKDSLDSNKVDRLMTLYPKLQDTVKEWIVCSNAKIIPIRIKTITKNIITYILYDDYIAESNDSINQEKEKNLWSLIHKSIDIKNIKIEGTFIFNFRNKLQERYCNDGITFASDQFRDGISSVLHWGEGSMGLGKSLLDQYINSTIQNLFFDKDRTNTDVPVNVNVFNIRRNAKQNGRRCIDIRKQLCGPVKTIWVTGAEHVKDEEDTIPHKQFLDVNNIVIEILDSIEKKIPVEIMTLNHHAQIIKDVEQDLKKHINGFKFWNINIDELDTLATLDSASNWNTWFKIKSCHRFGSTGTPVYNRDKNAKENPYMDNLDRFGPRSTFVSVKEAQDNHLIPPLCIHQVGVKLSELAGIPGMPTKGKLDLPILKTPVLGFKTIEWDKRERYMNVEELARFYGVIKTFCLRPDLFLNKHITGFTNFIAQAKLFKENFKFITDHLEGNSLVGRRLKKLVILLLNETKNSDINDKKLKRLFHEKEAIVISQKLLGRGVDLQFQTGFHLVLKAVRDMLQEIFRLMRLADKLAWADPKQQRHYILVTIINDIDPDSPTLDQDFIDVLNGIMEKYESAKTEMEMIWKGDSSGGKTPGKKKSFDAIDIDHNDMNNIVKLMSMRSASGGFLAGPAEKLHDKILAKMLSLPVPTSSFGIKNVLELFYDDKDFLDCYQLSECSKESFMYRFWRGHLRLCKNNSSIRNNVQKWKIHIKKYIKKREESVGILLNVIRDYYKKYDIKTVKAPDGLQSIIKDKANKLGINLFKGNGKYRANYVGDLIRGTNKHLSSEDQQNQSGWFKNICDQSLKNRQAALDKISEEWTFLYNIQEIARKYGIGKREIMNICYHPNIYPCKDENPNGAKFKGLDRSKWNERVTQEIKKTKKIVSETFELYKKWCEEHPHYYPDSRGVLNRNTSIKDIIKNKFGFELDNQTIRLIVGPFNHKDMKTFNGIYGSWIAFVENKKQINNWHKDFCLRVKTLRNEILQEYKKNGPSSCKIKFHDLDLKEDFIRTLKKVI